MKMISKTKKSEIPRGRLLEHDAGKTLGDSELVFKTFMECLAEGDAEAAAEVLAASLRHLNKTHLAKRHHIPRRSAYNLLTGKSAPNLTLVAKICKALRAELRHG